MNRTIFTGDNLRVMRGMDSETFDMIYLDPPFNSKREYHGAIGTDAENTSFDDVWHWSRLDDSDVRELAVLHPAVAGLVRVAQDVHGKPMASYLVFMALRLIEMHRVLKPTGSIWLHCDPTANSYIRVLMDAVFGKGNMRNEVVWAYTGPGSPKMRQFNRKHDTLFWYSKGDTWTFNKDAVRIAYKPGTAGKLTKTSKNVWGALSREKAEAYERKGKIPETWWTDIHRVMPTAKERTGYATQKPLALLERVIEASSNPDDLVLDPFCGCATTCVAADRLHRRWVGIDERSEAMDLVVKRLRDTASDGFGNVRHRKRPPRRTDQDPAIPKSKVKPLLIERDGAACAYCGKSKPPEDLQVDHVVPRRRGGPDHQDNYKLACQRCNQRKGTKSEIEYLRELEAERLMAQID